MSLVSMAPVVRARFPDLRFLAAVLDGVHVATEPLAFGDEVAEHVRTARTLDGLKDHPLFRAYRDFFWAIGIDPTKSRPSGEALNRRVLQGKSLPRINTFVDAYNLASLRTGVPVAAFDADRVEGGPEMRFGRAGEGFVSIGGDKQETLEGHELVIADAAGVIAFYPHRDCDRTKVTEATTRVLLVACGAPAVQQAMLAEALDLALELTTKACGGRVVARDAAGAP